jgi:hypothetical protein
VDAINQLNKGTLRAVYQPVFEPGAPLYQAASTVAATTTTLSSFEGLSSAPFREPANFINDLTNVLKKLITGPNPQRTLLVSDSITQAIKQYKLKERAGMGTFEGGVQPMDDQFLIDLGSLCQIFDLTIFAVVNPDRIPVGPRMEAITEGIGSITRVGTMTKRERGSGRVDVILNVPAESILAAAKGLNYPDRPLAAGGDHPFNQIP